MFEYFFFLQIPHLHNFRNNPAKNLILIQNISLKKAICKLSKNHGSSCQTTKSSYCSLGGYEVLHCSGHQAGSPPAPVRPRPPCPTTYLDMRRWSWGMGGWTAAAAGGGTGTRMMVALRASCARASISPFVPSPPMPRRPLVFLRSPRGMVGWA